MPSMNGASAGAAGVAVAPRDGLGGLGGLGALGGTELQFDIAADWISSPPPSGSAATSITAAAASSTSSSAAPQMPAAKTVDQQRALLSIGHRPSHTQPAEHPLAHAVARAVLPPWSCRWWIVVGGAGALLAMLISVLAVSIVTLVETQEIRSVRDDLRKLATDIDPLAGIGEGGVGELNPNVGVLQPYGRQPTWELFRTDAMCCADTQCSAELAGGSPYAQVSYTLGGLVPDTPTATERTMLSLTRMFDLLRMYLGEGFVRLEGCTMPDTYTCATGAWWTCLSSITEPSQLCPAASTYAEARWKSAIAGGWTRACARFCAAYHPTAVYMAVYASPDTPQCKCLDRCDGTSIITPQSYTIYRRNEPHPADSSASLSSASGAPAA